MRFLILEDNYTDADLSKRAILTESKNSTIDIAPTLDEARHLIANGNKYDLALFRIKDGAERWVHGTGELVYNERWKPVRMHGAIQRKS
jgi:hypothetical protein